MLSCEYVRPAASTLSSLQHEQDALGSDVVGHDASGNPILKDIGMYLRDNIKKHIKVSTAFCRQSPVL